MKSFLRPTALSALLLAALAPILTALAADDQAAVKQTIANFKNADPSLTNFFSKAVGYVVLPVVTEGGFIVAAQHGKGFLYEKNKVTGKVSLTEISVGAQVGGGTFSELVFLETGEALKNFKDGKCEMAGGAKATLAASGSAANAKYQQGVSVFTLPTSGAMVAAAIGGQRFKFEPIK